MIGCWCAPAPALFAGYFPQSEQRARPSPYPVSQFLGFMDVADFLAAFMYHLEKVKPPPVVAPLGPDTPRFAAKEGSSPLPRAALKPAVVERILKDEGRRQWIESVTEDHLTAAGDTFFSTSIRDARAQLCGNEDGRMVYAGKRDLPLLELVRGGFLRFILTPGSTQQGWDATEVSAETVATVPRRAIACHRVAIYRLDYDPEVQDDAMFIDAILSQSDVIRLLNARRDELGDVSTRSLHDIGLGGAWDDGSDPGAGAAVAPGDEVTCVLPTARALEAFSLMNAWGLSAVGVVSEPRGPLVDCLSVGDLRGVKAGDFSSLNASVSEFTRRRRMPGSNPSLITVRPDADLGEVIAKMCERGVHHVFVTDLEGRPVRMITPTDILGSITVPATHGNVGWRFQAAEISSKYAADAEREAEPTRMDDGRRFHDEM